MKRIFIVFITSFLLLPLANSQESFFTYKSVNDKDFVLSLENKLDQKIKEINSRYRSDIKKIYKKRHKNYLTMIKDSVLIYNSKIDGYLNTILQEIYSANPNIDHSDFTFFVNRSITPNAACFGDKNFTLNIGLFTFLESEDELASIISHEIAHYLLDHVDKNIINYFETVNRSDIKSEIKQIKSKKYGRNKAGMEFLKNLTFDFTRHSREKEIQADSLGYALLKNTKYNASAAPKALEKLDSIEEQIFQKKVPIKKILNSKGYPFRDKWLARENSLFDLDSITDDYQWNKDSLKTHPDAKLRADLLASNLTKNKIPFKKNDSLIKQLKREIVNLLIRHKRLDLALYLSLDEINKNTSIANNAFYTSKVAQIFVKLYTLKKHHEYGKYVRSVNHLSKETNLNEVKQFLNNLELKNIRKIGYNFCLSHQANMKNNIEFNKALLHLEKLNNKLTKNNHEK